MKSDQNGFTLIEIAVVLLIIGLVIGGVLFGRDLVGAAQVRKQISLFQEFNTAYHGFVSKFNAIPGDASEKQVGQVLDLPVDHYGDGNGELDLSTMLPGGETSYEGILVWEHLSKTGLIAGTYDGLTDSLSCHPVTSCPGSPLGGTLSHLMGNFENLFGGGNLYGKPMTTSSQQVAVFLWNGVEWSSLTGQLTAAQAFAIDSKADDGEPDSGRLLSITFRGGGAGTCLTDMPDVTDGSVRYDTTSGTDDCTVLWALQ